MATHSSVLAWRIPGTGEPSGLPSMGSHRVGHDWSNAAAAAAVKFSEKALSHVKKFTSILSLVSLYYWCWVLSSGFCESIDIAIFFLLYSTEMMNCNIRFPNIEKSCIPRINPAWSWCITLLLYCWIQLDILLKIFAVSMSDIGHFSDEKQFVLMIFFFFFFLQSFCILTAISFLYLLWT